MRSPHDVPTSPHISLAGAHGLPGPIGTMKEPEFKLAPTPAQLGKAPLQRRQSMGKHFLIFVILFNPLHFLLVLTLFFCFITGFLVAVAAATATTTSSSVVSGHECLPSSVPSCEEPTTPSEPLASPRTKKACSKKNKEDGMDKYVVFHV